eukprot:scaffold39147_cov58-Phaeocystis_antarctica.AAC.4
MSSQDCANAASRGSSSRTFIGMPPSRKSKPTRVTRSCKGAIIRKRQPQVEARDEHMPRARGHWQAGVREVPTPEDAGPQWWAQHERRREALGLGRLGPDRLLRPERRAAAAKVDVGCRERHQDRQGVAVLVRVEVAAARVPIQHRLLATEPKPKVAEVRSVGEELRAELWAEALEVPQRP